MIAPFGKIHKYDENFYKKKRADVVRVMVEVEDISTVPRVIHCSYKAITDNKLRFYDVKVIPFATCLPVSQWTENNYKAYEEVGGLRGGGDHSAEEGWEDVGEASRQGRAGGGAGIPDDVDIGAAGAEGIGPVNAGRVADIQGVARDAASAEEQEGVPHGRERMHARAGEKAEDMERRRKGKGVISDWALESGPGQVRSGSGSYDPEKGEGEQIGPTGHHSSDDAHSKAAATAEKARMKDLPIIISDESQQDEDLGGEGGRGGMVAPKGGRDRVRKVDESDIKPAPSQILEGEEATDKMAKATNMGVTDTGHGSCHAPLPKYIISTRVSARSVVK